MVGPGNQPASLISTLSVLRLVMVRSLNASNVSFQWSDHHWQNFGGRSCMEIKVPLSTLLAIY